MKSISLIKYLTAVVVLLCSGVQVAWAAGEGQYESNISAAERVCAERKKADANLDIDKCVQQRLEWANGRNQSTEDQNRIRQQCDSAKSASNTAFKEFQRACSNAGMSGNCSSKINSCESEEPEEDIDTSSLFQLNPLFGAAVGTFSNSGACASLTGSDFRSRKESLDREIKATNDDINQAKKDLNSAKNDLTEKFGEINDNIAELDKEKKESETAFTEDQNKQAQELKTNIRQAQAKIRSLERLMREQNQKKLDALEEKDNALLALTNKMMQYKCNLEVKSAKKAKKTEDLESGKKGSVSLQSLTASMAKNSDELSLIYYACIERAIAQRKSIINKYNKDMLKIEEDTQEIDAQKQELNQIINDLKASALTQDANAQTAKDNAQTAYLQSRQNLVQKMLLVNSNFESEQQQIAANIKRLEGEVQQNASEILNLGPQPKGSTTGTYREASRDYANYEAARASEYQACCATPEAKSVNGAGKCTELQKYEGKDQIEGDGTD